MVGWPETLWIHMVFEHHVAKPYDFIWKCIANNYSVVTVQSLASPLCVPHPTGFGCIAEEHPFFFVSPFFLILLFVIFLGVSYIFLGFSYFLWYFYTFLIVFLTSYFLLIDSYLLILTSEFLLLHFKFSFCFYFLFQFSTFI